MPSRIINMTMPEADSDKYEIVVSSEEKTYKLGNTFESKGAERMEIKDSGGKASLILEPDRKCNLWHFPVMTVSQSEKAYELNYQGSSIFLHLKMILAGGESGTLTLKVDLRV